jgi:hypothetical protein
MKKLKFLIWAVRGIRPMSDRELRDWLQEHNLDVDGRALDQDVDFDEANP